MELQQLAAQPHVSGSRATLKAIRAKQALAVFIAEDVEKRLVQPIVDACGQQGIPLRAVSTAKELGQAAKLQVPAAAAAIIK